LPYYKLKEKEEKNINTVYTREINRERERKKGKNYCYEFKFEILELKVSE